MNSNQRDAPPRKRIPRWIVAIAAVVVVGSLGLFCVGGSFLVLTFIALDRNTTDKDFATNQEKLVYLNNILPITLPSNATVIQFEQEGFQDQHIVASFIIPKNEIAPFIQGLPALDQPTSDVYEGRIGFTHIHIEVDRATGTIHLVWFET